MTIWHLHVNEQNNHVIKRKFMNELLLPHPTQHILSGSLGECLPLGFSMGFPKCNRVSLQCLIIAATCEARLATYPSSVRSDLTKGVVASKAILSELQEEAQYN